MRSMRVWSFALGAALQLLPTLAHADSADNADSGECYCDIVSQCPDSGVECGFDLETSGENLQKCRDEAEAKGLERRCKGGDYEAYCKADEVACGTSDGGCSVQRKPADRTELGAAFATMAVAGVIAGLRAMRRRRP